MELDRDERLMYSESRLKWLHYLSNAWYNGFIDMLNLSFALTILIFNIHLEGGHEDTEKQFWIAVGIESIFLTDMILNFFVVGPKKLWRSKKIMYFEIFLQFWFIFRIMSSIWNPRTQGEVEGSELLDLDMVFILRNFRLYGYLDVIRDAKFVSETVKYLSKPIMTKFFFVYLIFYEYAYLGAIIFGGEITYKVWDN